VLASDAFVVVPGGIGTVLEMLMIWQLLQVRHIKDVPLILVGTHVYIGFDDNTGRDVRPLCHLSPRAPQGRGGGSCGGGHVADRVVESTRGGCAVRLLTELRQLDTHSERTLVSFATAIMVFDDAVLVDDPYFARASR